MEHRGAPSGGPEAPRPRAAVIPESDRLALPAPDPPRRRLSTSRRIRIGLWCAVVIGGVIAWYLIDLAAMATRTFLAEQSAYQLPFREITLEPPPPRWYRGGAVGFLDDVRRRAKWPETLPLLALKKDDVKLAFRCSPWIEDVPRVDYRPLGLAVRILYRRPVAVVQSSSGRLYLVDRMGVILPSEDLDVDTARFAREQGLFAINGVGLLDPLDPKPGYPWQARPGAADVQPGNDKIVDAAKLAGFLLDRMHAADPSGGIGLSVHYINPMDTKGRGLFLKDDGDTAILWGEAPGEEARGSLTAEEKWRILDENARKGRISTVPAEDYWEITPGGLKHQVYQPSAASESALTGPPRRDRATIPAKGPG